MQSQEAQSTRRCAFETPKRKKTTDEIFQQNAEEARKRRAAEVGRSRAFVPEVPEARVYGFSVHTPTSEVAEELLRKMLAPGRTAKRSLKFTPIVPGTSNKKRRKLWIRKFEDPSSAKREYDSSSSDSSSSDLSSSEDEEEEAFEMTCEYCGNVWDGHAQCQCDGGYESNEDKEN